MDKFHFDFKTSLYDNYYKKEFISWRHFLTGNNDRFLSFEEAKKLLRKLKLKSYTDYYNLDYKFKKENRLPATAKSYYEKY